MDVKFNIDLNDNITAKLRAMIGVTKQLETVFRNIDTASRNIYKSVNKPIKLKVDSSEIDKAVNKLKDLQNKGGSNAGNKGGGIGIGGIASGNIIADLTMKALSIAKDVAMDSLKAAMDNQMISKSFEVLTGSAETGKNMTGDLRHLKESTIMGSSVYKNAQTMLGFGVGQGEVIKDLKQIGDIAMGDVDRMQSLTLAYSQTRAAGKLMGQDLLQYINAGFNPMKVMADHWKEMGFTSKKTMGQLKKDMSDGAISSEMVAKAFEIATSKGGQFYGMMDKIAETSAGKWKNLQGKWAGAQIDIGNALMPLANGFLDASLAAFKFLHIHKSATDSIQEEKTEVNYLFDNIIKLEKGNKMRNYYIEELNKKYPELLNNINLETAANDKLVDAQKRANDGYEKKLQYSETDSQMDFLKNKKDEAKRKRIDALHNITEVKNKGNNWQQYLPFLYGSLLPTSNEDFIKQQQKIVDEQGKIEESTQKEINDLDPTVKKNDTEKLQDRARAALGLSKEDAKDKWGNKANKNKQEIRDLLPNLTIHAKKAKSLVSGVLGDALGDDTTTTDVVNARVRDRLTALLDMNGQNDGAAGPNSSAQLNKSHNVTGNKQFIININGGLISQHDNHYESGNKSETAQDIERAIIDGIMNSLNALPGYLQ